MTDTTTPGAGEGEETYQQTIADLRAKLDNLLPDLRELTTGNGVPYDHERIIFKRIAKTLSGGDDAYVLLTHRELRAMQTIANLETVVHAYKRAAENAEQTTRELRKALEVAALALENRHRYEHTPQEPTWDDHERAGCGWCSDCLIKLDSLEEEAYEQALATIAATKEEKS